MATKARLVRASTATASGYVPTGTVRSTIPLCASSTLTLLLRLLATKTRLPCSSTATALGPTPIATVRTIGPASKPCTPATLAA